MRARVVAVVGVALAGPMASHALAEPGPWSVRPVVGTDIPLDVSAGVEVEGPYRLRAAMTIGVLPGPYVDLINAFLTGIGAYNDDTATLIHSALQNSLIWRTHAGWRPWERHGFYFMAGYGLVTLGGSAAGTQIVEAATGKTAPATDKTSPHQFDCNSTLHMLDVEFGWEWQLGEHWRVRAALGGAFTVAAHTTITPDYTPTAPKLTADFTNAGAAYLDGIYTSYVFSPVITGMAGYAF